jgi:AraC family transcriptional regulator of adaptative response/methylated-DNA-[protein]-cysteine methyltransferase
MCIATMPAKTIQNSATHDRRWQAVSQRRKSADGTFVYAVKSTGVYCRPSCSARLALRKNVEFYATPRQAEQAGYRPCKRCQPNQSVPTDDHSAAVALACRLIDKSDRPPSLKTLAGSVGISPWHFHRIFKSFTGLTPKAYALARRAGRVRTELATRRSVTSAIFNAGFNSSGRFYSQSRDILGMKPAVFKAGGEGATLRYAVDRCPLGSILVAASDLGICSIAMGDHPETLVRELRARFPKSQFISDDPDFRRTVAAVVAFVTNPARGLNLPLHVQGTAFQQRVWTALSEIPSGKTSTYSAIARKIGQPSAVRAVASACAANTLAVAIPCHRVVRNNGSLSGYRWGLARKASLLEAEQTGKQSRQ